MKVLCLGGGPAGLYFAISMKLRDPSHDVTLLERNKANDTFGWGVVLSDDALGRMQKNDPKSTDAIRSKFAYWDDIAVVRGTERSVSGGHGFAGIGRKAMLILLQERARELGDPETITRIKAYEMAFRMQTSVPELADISQESKATLDSYGPEVTRPGSYAANCLLARRLLERDVRFVQLFHRGWDQHVALSRQLPNQCQDIDQPTAALIKDLKARGLLEDTLVIFATEFGRTAFTQGGFGNPASGRDHHGRCFSVFLAGGGIKPGFEYGVTDEFAYNIAKDGVHLRDLHATILHCMGIDHERFTFKFRGLNVKLTGVEEAHVVKGVLA